MRTMNVAELKGAGVAAPLPRWLDIAIARYRPPPQVGDLKSFAAELQRYLNGASVTITSGAAGTWARVPGHAPLAWETPGKRRTFSHRKPIFHEETTALLLSFLIGKFRPDTFFDIGASSGYFARVAASHVTDAPTVHAFEMRPDYFAEMRRNLEHDGLREKVVLHHTCLSDRHVGELDFWYARMKLFEYEPERHEYQEAWWRRLKFFLRGKKDRGLVKARDVVTSIDRFVADHGVVPALVKIDVDGYEGKVLRGGLDTFLLHRPMIALELHRDKLIRFGDTRRDVVSLLFEIGYRALFLTDHQNPKACQVIPVDLDHPLIRRQETDFILFC